MLKLDEFKHEFAEKGIILVNICVFKQELDNKISFLG